MPATESAPGWAERVKRIESTDVRELTREECVLAIAKKLGYNLSSGATRLTKRSLNTAHRMLGNEPYHPWRLMGTEQSCDGGNLRVAVARHAGFIYPHEEMRGPRERAGKEQPRPYNRNELRALLRALRAVNE